MVLLFVGLQAAIVFAEPYDDALSAYNRGDYTDALQIWRSLANQGHARAQYNLGAMYENGLGVAQDYAEAMILSTGRLSSEILSKEIAAKTPVVVSKASPTSLAVEMARESGIVMIGNVRGRKFRVYIGREYVQE